MEKLLEEVAKATRLREGAEGVATVLRTIYAADSINLGDVSRAIGVPVPVVAAVRRELERVHLLERDKGLALTAKGRDFVENQLLVQTRHDPTCDTCEGRRTVIAPELQPALDTLLDYFGKSPAVDTTLDQAPCTPETSLRRALYLYESGALEGKRVIFLGEDDYVSLACALLGRALGRPQFARRLTVLESDPRILDHIRAVSRADDLHIECFDCDLRNPLPEDLRGAFDTFETDPPYTQKGIHLFVSRGVDALGEGVGKQGFLSFGARAPQDLLVVYRSLSDMGLAISEVIPGFNEYRGASLLGGTSQIVRLLTTPTTSPALSSTHYTDAIYTGGTSPTMRLYRCTQCRKKLRVGQGGNFETIEILKREGCPECGNVRFRYKGRVGRKAPALALSGAAPPSKGSIRLARAADLDDLARFEAEIARISFPEDPITALHVHRKRLEKALAGERAGMFVLEMEGRVSGWLWITTNTHFFTKERFATFRSLAVHPDERGTDAARALVRFAIEHAGREGAAWITGKVHVGNVPMRALYSEMGFHAKHLSMEYRFDHTEKGDAGGA